jgi:chaperonin GroEL (HSP60 family)
MPHTIGPDSSCANQAARAFPRIVGIFGRVLTKFIDMREHFVIDPLISKRSQLLLATQLCRMVLKVCIYYPLH